MALKNFSLTKIKGKANTLAKGSPKTPEGEKALEKKVPKPPLSEESQERTTRCRKEQPVVENNNPLSKKTTRCRKEQPVVEKNNPLSKRTTRCRKEQPIVEKNNPLSKRTTHSSKDQSNLEENHSNPEAMALHNKKKSEEKVKNHRAEAPPLEGPSPENLLEKEKAISPSSKIPEKKGSLHYKDGHFRTEENESEKIARTELSGERKKEPLEKDPEEIKKLNEAENTPLVKGVNKGKKRQVENKANEEKKGPLKEETNEINKWQTIREKNQAQELHSAKTEDATKEITSSKETKEENGPNSHQRKFSSSPPLMTESLTPQVTSDPPEKTTRCRKEQPVVEMNNPLSERTTGSPKEQPTQAPKDMFKLVVASGLNKPKRKLIAYIKKLHKKEGKKFIVIKKKDIYKETNVSFTRISNHLKELDDMGLLTIRETQAIRADGKKFEGFKAYKLIDELIDHEF